MQWGEYPSEQHARNAEKSLRWRNKNLERAREHTRAWRMRNLERAREQARINKAKWMAMPRGRMQHVLNQAKRRAKLAGIEFNITMEDISPLPTHCPIFGTLLNYSGTGSQRGFVNNSPSIDKIVPALGYTKGNVRVISWRANRIKADATIEELRQLLAYMEQSK